MHLFPPEGEKRRQSCESENNMLVRQTNIDTPRILLPVCLIFLYAMISAGYGVAIAQEKTPAPGTVHLSPAVLEAGDREMEYQEGLLFVPENRRAKAPRTIAVHFRRFPADDGADGPPVFYLPGGPGSELDRDELAAPDGQELIDFFTSVGDLVIVDQRGNPGVGMPFVPPMRMYVRGIPLDQPARPDVRKKMYRKGVRSALSRWKKRGVDLAGYDIKNIATDLRDLRKGLGYDEVILRGNSFGSQWSFAYLRMYPDSVARVMLGGVEPLNHTYDRPSDVLGAHKRIIDLVQSDPDLRPHLPDGGLLPAIRSLLQDLKEHPREVQIPHPQSGDPVTVTVGRYDLQQALKKFAPDYYTREGLKKWPRFVLELLDGNFRYLATLSYRNRQSDRIPLIFPLIDNSLGISEKRDRAIRNDPARSFTGPMNSLYYATRDLSPSPEVDDAFRSRPETDVPVLMIQGDLDRSTPIENARHILKKLENGHLLHVKNGTHLAIREVRKHHPDVAENLRSFLISGREEGLSEQVKIPPPDFQVPGETTLFEEMTRDEPIPE